ncbi:phytase [Granulicoccus sp. GXG6511]|uniref:phytase n=1 Tax=Granulicoccus sp. GXG6511 TaxID=3381351 RepID=UPI003D7EB5A9
MQITSRALAALAVPFLALGSTVLVAPAHAAPTKPVPSATVTARVQTPTLYDSEEGGNASGDDPAIWVHPTDSHDSLVLATAKEGGLRVYDLSGREVQALAADAFPNDGRYNNVDIAYGIQLGDRTVDLAVASDRYNDTLRFFVIDPAGSRAATPLTEVTAAGYDWLFVRSQAELEDETTAYGLAIWQPAKGEGAYAVVTQEGRTNLAVAEILPQADGTVAYRVVRELRLPGTFTLPNGTTWTPCEEPGVDPQFEGVTVDNANGVLYAAQEDVGLWRIDLEGKKAPVLIDKVTDFGIQRTYDAAADECLPNPGQPTVENNPFGGNITADAEGVDLYYGQGNTGYVILASQGSDEFLVYQRQGNNKLLGTFRVGASSDIDEVNGSDGLAVTNRPVGDFRQGLLVVHDEPHTGAGVDEDQDPTNFHFVQWSDVAGALDLPLNQASLRATNNPAHR